MLQPSLQPSRQAAEKQVLIHNNVVAQHGVFFYIFRILERGIVNARHTLCEGLKGSNVGPRDPFAARKATLDLSRSESSRRIVTVVTSPLTVVTLRLSRHVGVSESSRSSRPFGV